jgi:uncharacterized protein YjdB
MIYVKRLLATCAALALTATSTLPMTAVAISFESSTEKQDVAKGDTVTYKVKITDNDGVNGWSLLCEFDSSKLTYKKLTRPEITEPVKGYPNMTISSKVLEGPPANNVDNSVPVVWSKATTTYNGIFDDAGKDVPAEVEGKNYVYFGDNSGNSVAEIVFTADTDISQDELEGLVTVKGEKASRNDETGSGKTSVDVTVDNILVEKPVSITLDKTSATLAKGKSGTIKATVTNSTEAVTWTSDNENVATVDANGKVTAVGAGTATITASVGDKSATCKITVTDTTEVTITLDKSTISLEKGKTDTITATVTGSTDSVTWTSSNEAVATVDANGKVTGVAAGTATITAKVGGKSATCRVIVTATGEPTEITIPPQTVVEGKSIDCDLSIIVPNITDEMVAAMNVSIDDPTVVSYSNKGTTVSFKGLKEGVVTVTVTSPSPNYTFKPFTITVTPEGTTPINEIKIPDQTVTEGLTSSFNVSNAILAAIVPNLKVESLDPDVATVAFSSDNKSLDITGKKAGVAKAQITDAEGKVLGTFNITVEAPSDNNNFTADFKEKNIELKLGSTYKLAIVVDPENEDTAEFTDISNWTLASSDKTIVSVNEYGTITGLRSGEVTITATNPDYDGTLTAKVVVKSTFPVYVPIAGITNPGETVVPKPGDNKVDRAKVTPYVNAIVDSESKAGVIAATGGEMDSETGNAPAIAAAALGLIALGFVVVARKKRHS